MKSFYLICYHRVIALKSYSIQEYTKYGTPTVPPFSVLYLIPKSPSGPPGLWLAVNRIPPAQTKYFIGDQYLTKLSIHTWSLHSQAPQVERSHGKRQAQRQKGSRSSGAKVHNYVSNRCRKEGEAANRCLVSVWVKKGINRTILSLLKRFT